MKVLIFFLTSGQRWTCAEGIRPEVRWLRNQWIANNTASGRQKSRLRGFPWRCWRRSKTDGGGDGGSEKVRQQHLVCDRRAKRTRISRHLDGTRRRNDETTCISLLSPSVEYLALEAEENRCSMYQDRQTAEGAGQSLHFTCRAGLKAKHALPFPYNHYTLKCFISEHCYQKRHILL